MPRTKRPVKKTERLLEGGGESMGETLKKFDKLVADQKKKIDNRVNMEVCNIELAFKILIGSISKRHLNMTVGQLKNELHLKDTNTRRSRQSARAASHDDGYITENSSQGSGERGKKQMAPPPARSVSRRSRSADPSRAPPSARAPPARRRSKSVYRTPAYNKNAPTSYPTITPKVAPHTPLTVLRQPRQGEMVVSLTGSPVIVPTFSTLHQEEKANCNIMLADGTMLSLQPKQLRQSQAYIPRSLMEPALIAQLKTLNENIAKVVQMGEQTLK